MRSLGRLGLGACCALVAVAMQGCATEPAPPLTPEARLAQMKPVTPSMLSAPAEGDWLQWGRTYDGQNFSPLKQVNRETVKTLAPAWRTPLVRGVAMPTPLVHDGVMLLQTTPDTVIALDATSGAELVGPEAVAALRTALFPRAALLTPNLPELAHLAGRPLSSHTAMVTAAQELADATGAAVLAKGGHGDGATITDVLIAPGQSPRAYDHARIDTRHTHGTGCTLSSAIATLLGAGLPLADAVEQARRFVLAAITAAPGYGSGHGPLGHHAVG